MKFQYLAMIGVVPITMLSCIDMSSAYLSTGPPPDSHMTISLDEHGYAANDTITILGHVDQVLLGQDNRTMQIAVYNPNNSLYKSDQINIDKNGTYLYSFKISGPLGISGWYNVKVHPIPTEEVGIGMMYESSPYRLTIGNKTFSIQYALDYGKINSISVNPHERSLAVYTNNVRFMTIKLSRDLLDSKDESGNDAPFMVVTNYTKTSFEEAGSNDSVRVLKIIIPPIKQGYNILLRENAEVKITGTALAPTVNQNLIPYHIPSPLAQQMSGIPVNEIDCVDGMQLVVKSDTGTPACVKPYTAWDLVMRGWTSVNDLPSNVLCNQNCTKVLEKAGYQCNTGYNTGTYSCYVKNSQNITRITIPSGSSNYDSAEHNYEPDKIVVVLGENSTVQWQNKDDSSSSVTSDWNKFDSKLIMPGNSWTYVFDRPGIYRYHSVPHPWMRGEVIVLPHDDSYMSPIAPPHVNAG
ncbi:MAG: cupredoxin domain-containing protein [Thaumarchaeota archaeon]|nr:cupredoxin domain-containing protein [Nitrososphaerota archaeon]